MKWQNIIPVTASLMAIYVVVFSYYLWAKYPDNSKVAVGEKVEIRQRLRECNIYLAETKDYELKLVSRILKASIEDAADRVDKSRIRSMNNADYAMFANHVVWGGTIGAPLCILLLFAFVPSAYSSERNKSIGMVVAFLAVLNFVDSAYDSHGRWGFSRISQYHKESLLDQWLYRMNIGCATKQGKELMDLIYTETDALLKDFASHRNLVTPNFSSAEFNKIPDSSEVISGVTK